MRNVRGEGLCLNGSEKQYITQTDTMETDNTPHVTYVGDHFNMQISTETQALLYNNQCVVNGVCWWLERLRRGSVNGASVCSAPEGLPP